MPPAKRSAAVASATPRSAEDVLKLDQAEFAQAWLLTLRATAEFVAASPTLTAPGPQLLAHTRAVIAAAKRLESATQWLAEAPPSSP